MSQFQTAYLLAIKEAEEASYNAKRQRDRVIKHALRHGTTSNLEGFLEELEWDLSTHLDYKKISNGIREAQALSDYYGGYRGNMPYLVEKYASLFIKKVIKETVVKELEREVE